MYNISSLVCLYHLTFICMFIVFDVYGVDSSVEAPLWYEPTPETDGTPLLTAPSPLSPSYARRKSVVMQDPDTANKVCLIS
jgi:hypothetical protein